MSFETDHVPSIIRESSFPAEVHIFEDNEAVIRMNRKITQSQFETLTTNSPCSSGWIFERIKLDSCIFFQYVRTTEQLADIFTKSDRFHSMEVFDAFIHPPSGLNVDRSLSESSCSPMSLKKNKVSRCRTPTVAMLKSLLLARPIFSKQRHRLIYNKMKNTNG